MPARSKIVRPGEEESRRTSALAYWRYAHEYLRAARTLATQHRVPSVESQPLYHLCAQALEFALKAFLRARGIAACELVDAYGRAIERSLEACVARGLAAPPGPVLAATRRLAAHHRPDGFATFADGSAPFADLKPGCDAVCWVLEATVPVVAEDYALHYAERGSPSTEDFVARLRADLNATRSGYALAS